MDTTSPNAPIRYIALEGCIGVGKTTLTHLLSEHYGAERVLEVVEENPFLPDFYKDSVAHAFKTQMFFLLSRFKQQEALHQGDLFHRTVIADYMFEKDRIFAELTLSPSELALYDQIFNTLKSRMKTPDLTIYLRAPLDVILERIRRRGRSFEQSIDPGYLERLIDAYNRHFARPSDDRLLIIDTAQLNFPERPEDFERVVSIIDNWDDAAGTHQRVLAGEAKQPAFL